MPSGAGGRKKPFSGKQKKQQLLAKREKQQGKDSWLGSGVSNRLNKTANEGASYSAAASSRSGGGGADGRTQLRNEFTTTLEDANSLGCKFFEVRQPTSKADAGRYALMFRKETKEELNRQKQEARKTLQPVLEEYLECKIEDFFTPELEFPIRPKWSYELTREQLERNEYKYFHEYLKKIDAKFQRTDLSYFELNLETWRQLWRVLEMSDILLCIVDIRFPPLLFPPKLYDYVCKELGKSLILVLNKIDLCPAPLVLAWKDYFKTKYPELHVLCFTSFPSYNVCGSDSPTALHGKRRKGKQRMAAEGALELYKVCADLVQGEVDLSSWKAKIMEEMNAPDDVEEDDKVEIENVVTEKVDTGFYDFKKYSSGIFTIGCVGQPNVGKSSLINALMGKKVVSVSRTPGHTKHFQTIFLTPTVRLCDCPGLIFPSKIPKSLQVLCGSYPIAQLREPFSTVKYLAERLDLPKILKIVHPEGESEWCAMDIADGWAAKRGYLTAKAARLDSYRGANQILRLALEGRIRLCLYPPGYYSTKDQWSQDPRISEILDIQAKSQESSSIVQEIELSNEEDNEPEGEEGGDSEEQEGSDAISNGESEKEETNESPSDSKHTTTTKKKKGSAPGVTVANKFALLLGSDDDEDE